jgi:hypothetical protein
LQISSVVSGTPPVTIQGPFFVTVIFMESLPASEVFLVISVMTGCMSFFLAGYLRDAGPF